MKDDIIPRPSTFPVAHSRRKSRGEKHAAHGAAAKHDDDDDDYNDGGKQKKKARGYKDNAVAISVVDSGDEENDVRAHVPKKKASKSIERQRCRRFDEPPKHPSKHVWHEYRKGQ